MLTARYHFVSLLWCCNKITWNWVLCKEKRPCSPSFQRSESVAPSSASSEGLTGRWRHRAGAQEREQESQPRKLNLLSTNQLAGWLVQAQETWPAHWGRPVIPSEGGSPMTNHLPRGLTPKRFHHISHYTGDQASRGDQTFGGQTVSKP